MTAWSKDFTNIPKDKPFLVNHPDWMCCAVMSVQNDPEYGDFLYYEEELISDVEPGFRMSEILDDSEHKFVWTNIPE